MNETLDRVGVSYRQLDYWLRNGAIGAAVGASGSGSRREFAEEQIPALQLCACVASLGLHHVVHVVGIVWDQIEADPDLLHADVLFLTEDGLTVEPGFGFCIPRSAWWDPATPEHAVA